MNNKLSELSKPVAWVTMQREFCDDERSVITNEVEAEKYSLDCYDLTPLYSQEYVSALREDAAKWFKAFEKAVSVGARYEERIAEMDADLADRNGIILEQSKRIAELERANQSQDDHINQQQDRIDSLEKTNAGLGRGLAAAETRLATPVRLPKEIEPTVEAICEVIPTANPDEYACCIGADMWNGAVKKCRKLLLKQGFTVEGDE